MRGSLKYTKQIHMKLPSHPPDYKSIVSSSPLCVSEDVLQTLHDPWSWNHTFQGDRFVQLTQTSPKPLIYMCTGSSRRINIQLIANRNQNCRWNIARKDLLAPMEDALLLVKESSMVGRLCLVTIHHHHHNLVALYMKFAPCCCSLGKTQEVK